MNLEEIKELIQVMRKNRIGEIDLEQEGSRVRIVASQGSVAPAAPAGDAPLAAAPAALPRAEGVAESDSDIGDDDAVAQAAPASNLEEIRSPRVGTFYAAPSPDAPPYVEVGAVVNPDTVLCIIEAMKLMNEVKAEVRGKIVRTLVEYGQPVEYNQPLFEVEPF